MLKDVKEGTTTGRKPDTTHVRSNFLIYSSRPAEYGCDKYERANYLRPTGEESHTTPTKADVARLRNYVRASMDHARKMLDAIEHYEALDPEFKDIDGLRRASYAADTDTTPGNAIGPSLLPHIAPACTSLMMAIEQAIGCGLLPPDPGQPWKRGADRAVSWSVDYIDGSSAMVWRSSPDTRADGWQTILTHAAEPLPPVEGCRSIPCAIDNRCTGYFGCPRHAPSDRADGRETIKACAPEQRGAESTPRDERCRSNECAIRNRCTGYAWCPRSMPIATETTPGDMFAVVDRLAETLYNTAEALMSDKATGAALDDSAALTGVSRDPDAARFAEIEANIQRTKADADKLAEEKAQRDARPSWMWNRCSRCHGVGTVTPTISRYGAGEETCPACRGSGTNNERQP